MTSKYVYHSVIFKLCQEERDDEYITFCNFIIFDRIMIGFKLIEGDLRRACTQEPLKKIDFNPYLSPTPLPFHCDILFE